jgi:tRNA(Ile)-lysidine synthase
MPPIASTASLPERFRAHLARTRLFRVPGTAIVAVSGGADSVALLDLLHGVAPDLGLTLVVAHVDHGIQMESGKVGKMVQELAGRYALPFELSELHLGPDTTETEARRARYAWLREVQHRRDAAYLVTAHHQDDQIETVVLRALRGSAPAGLAGIARRGRDGLVRPLLPFTHRDLVAHAAARGLAAHDDPANADPRHLRSWVRTLLLPLLKDRLGPRVAGDLRRLGRHAAEDRYAWDRALELVPELGLQVSATGFAVAREGLCGYDDALAIALLRAAARRTGGGAGGGGGLVLGPARARRLLALARRPSGRRLALGGGWTAEVAFDRLRVARTPAGALDRVVPAGESGSALFGAFRIDWAPAAAPARVERAGWTTWVDGPGWEVRAPARGDELVPLGGVGHRRLRRLLMEARVPRSERARYPVVARGATILWVPGICRGTDGLPAPGTKAVRLDVTQYGAAQANRRA